MKVKLTDNGGSTRIAILDWNPNGPEMAARCRGAELSVEETMLDVARTAAAMNGEIEKKLGHDFVKSWPIRRRRRPRCRKENRLYQAGSRSLWSETCLTKI